MQHYPTCTHTRARTHYTHRENYVFCAPVLHESWMVVGESRGPPYPVKGCDRLTQNVLCPPSMFRTIMLAVKERFESNQRIQGGSGSHTVPSHVECVSQASMS